MGEIQGNVLDIREYVNIQAQYENSASAAMDRCKEFLNSGKFLMVRKGDVYGFMVEHYAKNNQFKPAFALLEDMRNKIPNVNVAYYINVQTIRAIEQALNTKILSNNQEYDNDEDEDGIIDETDRYN